MKELNVALATIGGLTLVLSLIAGFMRNKVYFLSEPMAAVLLGIVIGPAGIHVLDLANWGEPLTIIEQVARLTVGLAVMAAALRLPRRYFREHVTSMGAVLLAGMIGMWLVSSGVVYLLFDIPYWVALLVGAIVTPTDPVLAGTIVTGSLAEEEIPAAVRHVLTGESGANDGLAYPFVFLPILALQHPLQRALTDWIVETLLWEVGLAVALGALIGAATGFVEQKSSAYDYLEETSLLSVTVAFTFAVLGVVKLLGSDGILAAFVAGLLFNRLADPADEAAEQRVQETVLRLFTFPVFVVFGLALPWTRWFELGGVGVLLVVGVLLLRRVPVLVVFHQFASPIRGMRDASFAAWFGPVGIAALYYATVAHRIVGHEFLWPAASLVIAGSILAHGVTATPLTKVYGRATDENRAT